MAATHATNNRQIAKAIGLSPKEATLAEISEWQLRSDFPEMSTDGFLISELKEWHKKFLKDSPKFSTAELKRARDASLRKKFAGGKPLTREDKIDLRRMGLLLDGGEVAEVLDGVAGSGGFSMNQAALTEFLAKRFGSKFGFILSEMKISEWLRGKCIPAGAKPPPTKIRNRFNNDDFATWVEATFGQLTEETGGRLLQDDFRRMDKAKLEQAENSAALSRIELENSQREHDEKWMLRESAIRTAQSATATFQNTFKSLNERGSVDAMRTRCQSKSMSIADVVEWCEWESKRGIERTTAFEDAICELGRETTGDASFTIATTEPDYVI